MNITQLSLGLQFVLLCTGTEYRYRVVFKSARAGLVVDRLERARIPDLFVGLIRKSVILGEAEANLEAYPLVCCHVVFDIILLSTNLKSPITGIFSSCLL